MLSNSFVALRLRLELELLSTLDDDCLLSIESSSNTESMSTSRSINRGLAFLTLGLLSALCLSPLANAAAEKEDVR